MVQTEFSGFFTGRSYNEDSLTSFVSSLLTDGLFIVTGTHLETTADGSGMTVSVNVDDTLNIARAIIQGHWYELISAKTLTIGTADATNDRIDRIILRLDKASTAESPISLQVLQGTPSATPTAPDISRSGNIWDLSLAQVYVTAGVSVIASDKITDERADTNVCGPYYAANQDAQIGSLIARYNSMVANNSKIISKSSGIINTAYDEKMYFFIPDYAVTVEMLVIGRKPSATNIEHVHTAHGHGVQCVSADAGTAGYLSADALIQSSPPGYSNTGVVISSTVGSGNNAVGPSFPNGLTVRVNGDDEDGTHGPFGTGSADYIGSWIDITSEITVNSVNTLEFLATTSGCIADIEIRYV